MQEALIERLKTLQWAPGTSSRRGITYPLRFTCGDYYMPFQTLEDQRPPNPLFLRKFLSVLREVRLQRPAGASAGAADSVEVVLSTWQVTEEVISELSGLPEWCGELIPQYCGWPLQPAQYRRLAEVVPTSYHTWRLPPASESPFVPEIAQAVGERRKALGLPRLRVKEMDHKVGNAWG